MENFFIAIVAPEEIAREITEFKEEIATLYGSTSALRSPAHITLLPPFKLAESERAAFLSWFTNLSFKAHFFQLQLNGFGAFANKNRPVIFVNPVENENLNQLCDELSNIFVKQYPLNLRSDFHPHMTIAFKDLSPDAFDLAWKTFENREFSASFLVEEISLLQHDGKKWNVIETKALET